MESAEPIRDDAAVADSAQLPVAVPVLPPRVAANVAGLVAPGSAAAESMSVLRNFLFNQHLQQGRRALAICAPTENTGCTFVAVNLALAMAHANVNTLLIDGNLRDPGVDSLLTPDRSVPGLAEFLTSPDDRAPFLLANARPNLSVIFAGRADGQASDLLARQKLKTLINESVRSFDFTIIDCPPAAQYGDARRVASVARHALIVARRDHSYSSDVKTLVGELKSDGVNIVGTFLNIVD